MAQATQIKGKPILFMGSMVKAILHGKKTQTRRPINFKKLVKGANVRRGRLFYSTAFNSWAIEGSEDADLVLVKCPYGEVGTHLWVRETYTIQPETAWAEPKRLTPTHDGMAYYYKATFNKAFGGQWKPSIFMPRAASRLTLEVLNVRVERLQDISEEDAIAEGFTNGGCLTCGVPQPCGCDNPRPDCRDEFIAAWMSKYGHKSWEANPWVWVVSFKRLEAAGGSEVTA